MLGILIKARRLVIRDRRAVLSAPGVACECCEGECSHVYRAVLCGYSAGCGVAYVCANEYDALPTPRPLTVKGELFYVGPTGELVPTGATRCVNVNTAAKVLRSTLAKTSRVLSGVNRGGLRAAQCGEVDCQESHPVHTTVDVLFVVGVRCGQREGVPDNQNPPVAPAFSVRRSRFVRLAEACYFFDCAGPFITRDQLQSGEGGPYGFQYNLDDYPDFAGDCCACECPGAEYVVPPIFDCEWIVDGDRNSPGSLSQYEVLRLARTRRCCCPESYENATATFSRTREERGEGWSYGGAGDVSYNWRTEKWTEGGISAFDSAGVQVPNTAEGLHEFANADTYNGQIINQGSGSNPITPLDAYPQCIPPELAALSDPCLAGVTVDAQTGWTTTITVANSYSRSCDSFSMTSVYERWTRDTLGRPVDHLKIFQSAGFTQQVPRYRGRCVGGIPGNTNPADGVAMETFDPIRVAEALAFQAALLPGAPGGSL